MKLDQLAGLLGRHAEPTCEAHGIVFLSRRLGRLVLPRFTLLRFCHRCLRSWRIVPSGLPRATGFTVLADRRGGSRALPADHAKDDALDMILGRVAAEFCDGVGNKLLAH